MNIGLTYSSDFFPKRQKQTAQGFTLLELLVVIVIVGIMVGMITLATGNSQTEQMKEEAKRFQALLQLAQDEAIMQSRQLALGFHQNGYAFFQQSSAENEEGQQVVQWVVKNNDEILRPRSFDETWQLQLSLENLVVILPEAEKLKAQIFILSSGEMTPFIFEIKLPLATSAKIDVNAIGQMTISYQDENNAN